MNTLVGLSGDLLESSLEAGVEAAFAVAGNSMRPLLRPGDVVRVRRSVPADPRLGDVVAVRGMPEGGLLLHRVVKVRDGRLLLRGDNSVVDNGEWPVEAVLGIVARVEREGRPVWFGSGRWGRGIAWLARSGSMRRLNRITRLLVRPASRRRPDNPNRPA